MLPGWCCDTLCNPVTFSPTTACSSGVGWPCLGLCCGVFSLGHSSSSFMSSSSSLESTIGSVEVGLGRLSLRWRERHLVGGLLSLSVRLARRGGLLKEKRFSCVAWVTEATAERGCLGDPVDAPLAPDVKGRSGGSSLSGLWLRWPAGTGTLPLGPVPGEPLVLLIWFCSDPELPFLSFSVFCGGDPFIPVSRLLHVESPGETERLSSVFEEVSTSLPGDGSDAESCSNSTGLHLTDIWESPLNSARRVLSSGDTHPVS